MTTKERNEISEITSTGEALDDTTLKLFEMMTKFNSDPDDERLQNYRAAIGVCTQEIRRLRAENEELKKDRDDLINVVNEWVVPLQLNDIAEESRLIALGKAVEAMENFWILEKLPGPNGRGIQPLWHVYKGTTNFQNDIQASESCASPLEALNKAKEH
jgi:hypothetical protein